MNFSYKSYNRFYDFKAKFGILERAEIEITDDEFCNNFQIISVLARKIKIIKIIDQLIKLFEELEELLDSIKEKTKAGVLWGSFCACLQPHNHVRSLHEAVELYRSMEP